MAGQPRQGAGNILPTQVFSHSQGSIVPVMNVPAKAFAESDVHRVLISHTEGCGSAARLMPHLAGKFPTQATDPFATLPRLADDQLRERIGDEGRCVTN